MTPALAGLGVVAALIQLQGDPLAPGRFSGSVRLPLERAAGGDTPVLTFTSPRGPVRLLLDTGASTAMLTPAAAQRLELSTRPIPPQAFALAGGGSGCGEAPPRRTSLPPLILRGEGEGASLQGAEALVLAVAALPPGVDGLLGAPSLRQLPIRVDPRAARVSIGPIALGPSPATAMAPRDRLPLEWRRGVPVLRMTGLNGPVHALADTGAEGLFISPGLASGLHPLGATRPLRLVGVCGEQQVHSRRYAGLGLNREQAMGTQARGLEAIVTANPIFAELDVEAILGQELLRERIQLWRLDQPRPRLELW